MATLTGHLVADTYKALLKMIDNDILTAAEKQISDGLGGGTNVFIDQNGFLRANKYKVTGATSSQFLKGDGSLDSTAYLPVGTTTTNIPEGTNLYFTTNRVLNTLLTGFAPVSGTVTATDSILTAINKIWWNIVNGGGGGGGGYVPYTGALQSVNLGEWGLSTGFISLDNTPTGTPTTAGTMSWNDADGTADLKLKGGNVTLQIGQEEVLRVVNKTGATLAEADFRAVRIRSVAEGGAQGQRLAVVLAQGNNDPNSATTIGIVTENILNNEEGFITTSGEVKKIDTTGAKSYGGLETWVDGDVLYLSPTYPGYLTKVKPQAPNHTIIVGWVVYAHAVNGKIFVKVDNGYELDELHNVKITNPQDDDFLMYDSVESVWINKDLHGTKGYLPYYYDTKVFEQSPIFTDGSQVIIGSNTEFATGNKLSVVGNLAVDSNYGYHLGTYQILFRYNATGEFRIGTNAANDFTTFFANGIERMRLNASGYLGIGLTSPTQPLHVKGVLAYPKIIIDNNSASGGGVFSAYQNGTETANFGISGAWLLDNSSDVAIVATRAGNGIQFYTNGSTSEKMGINSDGNVFVGQTPTYVAGATQLIVRGKTGAGFSGVMHYDMSIKGSMNTFNNVFQIGTSTFHSVAVIVEDIERARFNSSGRLLLGTTTDNTVDMLQVNGSIVASAIKKSGGTSSQYLMADGSVSTLGSFVPTSRTLTINGTAFDLSADRSWSVGTVTSVGASVPTGFAISGSPITTSGTLAITFATGYSLPTNASQSNWDTAYTNRITSLTTTGSSGSATLVSNVLNIPTYTLSGLGGVPTSRLLTINGVSFDLSADRTWTVAGTISGLTTNFIPKATSATTLGNSNIQDNGTSVSIGGSGNINLNNFIGGIVTRVLPTGNTFAGQTFNITGSADGWNLINRNTWNINDDAFINTGFTLYDNRAIITRSITSPNGYVMNLAYFINNGTASQSATGIVSFSAGSGNFGSFVGYRVGATGNPANTNSYTEYVGFKMQFTPQNVTNYYGISINDFTGTSLSRGLELNLSSGTNKWNIYASGTANNYMAGSLGIGTTTITGYNLRVSKNITGATTSFSVRSEGTIQSDVTSQALGYSSFLSTQATAFTLIELSHYSAAQGTIGSGSTVTNQYGYRALSSLTGATNNYGFHGDLTAATGRWNLYMNGTANNYLAGSLGIGITALTGVTLYIGKQITGAVSSYGVIQQGNVLSDVTTAASGFYNIAQIPSGTALPSYTHYSTEASAFVGTVTTQTGFRAASTLTGATNNYGFRGLINAGTGRWNLYMDGTANNFLGGSLGIGTTQPSTTNLYIRRNLTGSTTMYNMLNESVVQSDVTSVTGFFNQSNTQAATFTLTTYTHFQAAQGTIGAGSTITTQQGFVANAGLIGATNNYGFRGLIPSGTGRWNLYIDGTADNHIAGSLGIGGTALTGYNLRIQKNPTGSATFRNTWVDGTIQSDVITSYMGIASVPSTQATVFTLPNLYHFIAAQGTFGVGSTVTNQYGFFADSNLTSATNDYGFYGNIASGTGRWNLYMNGTAQNYLAGDVGIGVTVNHASAKLQVDSTTEGFLPPRMTAAQRGAIASPAEGLVVVQTDGTQGLYIYIGAAWHALTML